MFRQSQDLNTEESTDSSKKTLTWKDSRTGLEWQFHSPGKMTWHEALEYADSLELDGRNDWRLPAARELETLIDRKTLLERIRPIMREDVPFRDTLSYWSSTTFSPDTNSAWIVMFDGGYILSYYKSNQYNIRCVRGSFLNHRSFDLVHKK